MAFINVEMMKIWSLRTFASNRYLDYKKMLGKWGVVQVGAGLWLHEPAAGKRHAEALAKAKYAESRDARTCALFYAALGKKNLLQVPIPPLTPPPYEKVTFHQKAG